ncbi:MAG TPA: hypothetical protein VIM08_16255 [Arthrobacter sp.]|jgi:hypothetical protein
MTPNACRVLKTVDEMLADAGESHARELRSALVALGSFAVLPAPAPGAELSALMAGSQDQLARRRRLSSRRLPRHRPTAIGLAVIAGMGLGASGVAATAPVHGQPASTSIQSLLQGWGPSWTIAGDPSTSAAGSLPGPQPGTPSLSTGPDESVARAALVPATEPAPAADARGNAPMDSVHGAEHAAETARGIDVAPSRKAQETTSRETERAADRMAREFDRAQELFARQWLKKFNH